MIIVRFTSGLGNQMFQYSFYQFLKNRYKDTRVLADLTWFYANNDHHGYELQRVFGSVEESEFSIEEASYTELFRVTGLVPNIKQPADMITAAGAGRNSADKAKAFEKLRRYPNRILREFTQEKRAPYMIDQLSGAINNMDIVASDGQITNEIYDKVTGLDVSKDWYITGFWIEEKYIINRIDSIRRQLVFPVFTDGVNTELANRIVSGNSVSIHVRRGDYLSATYESMFVALGSTYYKKAVDYIKENVDKPEFYIFSDDVDFVNQEFNWLDNKIIVSNNSGDDSYRDMQLMSLCKHNIIANSTFSQWGALLNRNENHITVYPAAYLKGQDNEIKKMPGWVRI